MTDRLPPDWFPGITPTLPEWQGSFQDAIDKASDAATAYTDSAVSPVAADLAAFKATTNAGIASGSSALSSFQATVNAALANGRPTTFKMGALGWLEALVPSTETNADFISLSTKGGAAGLFASRASDNPTYFAQGTWSVGSFAFNDNPGANQTVYGFYGEAFRNAGTGAAQGLELSVSNHGEVVDGNPYSVGGGMSNGIWIGSGRDGSNDATMALGILGGGSLTAPRFKRGIVIVANSVAPITDIGAPAINLALSNSMLWFAENQTVSAFIRSDINATSGFTLPPSIVFTSTGLDIRTADGLTPILLRNGLTRLLNTSIQGTLTISPAIAGNYANDAAAAAAGIPLYGVYRNSTYGNCLKMRES